MQTFAIRAFAADVLNTKFLAFNTPNIKNTFTSNASNAKKKKKKKIKKKKKKTTKKLFFILLTICLLSLASFFSLILSHHSFFPRCRSLLSKRHSNPLQYFTIKISRCLQHFLLSQPLSWRSAWWTSKSIVGVRDWLMGFVIVIVNELWGWWILGGRFEVMIGFCYLYLFIYLYLIQ